MSLITALYSRLANHSGTAAIVGTRIMPDHLDQTPTIPSVVYRVESQMRHGAMGADTGLVEAQVFVVSYQSTALLAEALGAQVQAALARYSGTVAGVVINAIFIHDEGAEYDDGGDDNWSHEQGYTVHYYE